MRPFAVVRGYRAGIRRIALATDAGNCPHGGNARDLVGYVKHGLPEMFELKAATVDAAGMPGMSGIMGTIETGKRADIIATSGNPMQDISAITRVIFVIRDGVVYRKQDLQYMHPKNEAGGT